MENSISIISWNINGETTVSDSQQNAQLDFLTEHCSKFDIICLQAVRNEQSGKEDWDEHLDTLLEFFRAGQEGFHVEHTGDWANDLQESTVQPHAQISNTHNRCHLTASRWPTERRPLSLRNTGDRKPRKLDYYYSHFPEKLLVTDVDTSEDDSIDADRVEVWNVGIVNGANWGEEKVNMLETVYARIYLQNRKMDHPVVLAGDFNAPMKETSGRDIHPHSGPKYTNYPGYGDPYYYGGSPDDRKEFTFGQRWRNAEQQLFDQELGEWDMQDAYLSLPPEEYEASTEDYTHVIHNGSPSKKRLDHVLVSDHFSVRGCDIWNGRGETPDGLRGGGQYKSDHAPVVADVDIVEA